MIRNQFPEMIRKGQKVSGYLSIVFAVFIITCVMSLLLLAASRCVAVLQGFVAARKELV